MNYSSKMSLIEWLLADRVRTVWLILMIITSILIVAAFVIPPLYDPHQSDENYCGVYQATLNWNNVPYTVNFNVAEKVCTCTSKTLPSNSTWYSCERKQ
jgi:hypothetical protein